MSIQPLGNNTVPTYSPAADSKPVLQAIAAKKEEPASPAARNSSPDETKGSKQVVDKEAIRHATQKANEAISGLRSDLKFSIDDETGVQVVKFIDVKTKEVIRQIPAQEMLVIAKRLDELQGLLIKEKA